MKTKEEIYDEQIAPILVELGALCREHEMPFMAIAGFEDGNGTTFTIPGDNALNLSQEIFLVYLAMQAQGSIDAVLIALIRNGLADQSIFLQDYL